MDHNPRIAVVCTGTELATGRRMDSNGPWLAGELFRAGFELTDLLIVPDDGDLLFNRLDYLIERGSIQALVVTGGLGATADDLTVDTLARLTARKPCEEPDALNRIKKFLRLQHRSADLGIVRRQARILDGAQPLPNRVGIAPGMVIDFESPTGNAITIIVLPGVPHEMEQMFAAHALQALRDRFPRPALGGYRPFGISVGFSGIDGERVDRFLKRCVRRTVFG